MRDVIGRGESPERNRRGRLRLALLAHQGLDARREHRARARRRSRAPDHAASSTASVRTSDMSPALAAP